jgi:hypothetical protein
MKMQISYKNGVKNGLQTDWSDTPAEAGPHFDAILPILVNGQKARSVLVEE